MAMRMARSALRVALEELAHRRRHIRPLQREGDLRFQEAGLVAAVEAAALVTEAVEGLGADEARHAVRELHLAAGAALHAGEVADHLRRPDGADGEGVGGGG